MEMATALKSKRCIIYVDEVMFTSRSILKREYSNRYTNIMVDYNDFTLKTTAVIAAISREHGLVHYMCTGKSVN